MSLTTWIGTPKALYRMARRGGDDWNRLKGSLSLAQREELSRLNQGVETLAAELRDAKDVVEKEGLVRQERQRLRKPWEEARQAAGDPPEEFVLATRLVDLLHLESSRKYRSKDLAKRLDVDVNSPVFLEAVSLSVAAGFADWTTSGKLRAVRTETLRDRGMEFDRFDSSLAKMSARIADASRCTLVDAPRGRIG